MSIRILLALMLTLWSPAWCCCSLRSAAATVLDDQCQAAKNSCCAATVTREKSCCDESDSPCRCADRQIELNRLDTAPRASVPAMDQNALAVFCDHEVAGQWRSASTQPAQFTQAPVHPPPLTLVAQHCLLLI